MGDNNYLHTSAPITNPFDPNQKLIFGATVTPPIITEPVGSGGSVPIVPGIPETNLDNLTEITGINESIVCPCYVLPKFTSLVFTSEI